MLPKKPLLRFALLAMPLALAACATSPSPPPPAAVTEQRSTIAIEVHESDELALFLFAYHAARSQIDRPLRSRLPLDDIDAALLAEHRAAFAPVAAAFEPYLDGHPGFNRTLFFTGAILTGAEAEFPDPALPAALDAFMPVYSAHFLPRHRELTRRLRARLERQLAQHGEAMARAVAREIGAEWREEPIRLDLAPYVTFLGAYTNSHHTVMSASHRDFWDHSLEMAFHEAAHTSPMDEGLKPAADAALAKHGLKSERFWHYLQFYAIGRAAQSVLGPDYVPYHEATGLSQRGGRDYYAALDEVWDDHTTLSARADAAAALVAARQAEN